VELINNHMNHESNKEPEVATFVLQIKLRQNKTWQGTIKWLEKKKTLNFRSALELIKIIESTNQQGYQVEMSDIREAQYVMGK